MALNVPWASSTCEVEVMQVAPPIQACNTRAAVIQTRTASELGEAGETSFGTHQAPTPDCPGMS